MKPKRRNRILFFIECTPLLFEVGTNLLIKHRANESDMRIKTRVRPPSRNHTAIITRLKYVDRILSRMTPRRGCLRRAESAQRILFRHGICSTIRYGIASLKGNRLCAHAWLSVGDQIIGDALPLERTFYSIEQKRTFPS